MQASARFLDERIKEYDDFLKGAFDANNASIPVATLADSPRILKLLEGVEADGEAASGAGGGVDWQSGGW